MKKLNISQLFDKQNIEQKKNWWFSAILMIAFLVIIWAITTQLNYDNITSRGGFYPLVMNLVNGDGYNDCYEEYFPFCGPDNQVTAMREPIPIFLMAAGMLAYPSIQSFALVQSLLYLGTIIVVYLILKKEDVRLALLAAFFWATSIPVIGEVGDNNGELTAAFFFSLGIYYFLQAVQEKKLNQYLAAGFFMGIASLSRTVFLGIAVGWIIFLAITELRKPIRTLMKPALNMTVFFITLCLIVTPWVIRNKLVFGTPVIGSTLTGYNIFRMHYYLGDDPFVPHYVGSEEAYQAVKQLVQTSELTGKENEAQMNDVYMDAGKAIILKYPLRYIAVSLYRFPMLWFNYSIYQAYGLEYHIRDYITIVQQIFFLIAVTIGSIKFYKPYMPLVLSLVLGIGAYMAVNAQLRYLIDIMPAVVILATLGVSGLINKFSNDK